MGRGGWRGTHKQNFFLSFIARINLTIFNEFMLKMWKILPSWGWAGNCKICIFILLLLPLNLYEFPSPTYLVHNGVAINAASLVVVHWIWPCHTQQHYRNLTENIWKKIKIQLKFHVSTKRKMDAWMFGEGNCWLNIHKLHLLLGVWL